MKLLIEIPDKKYNAITNNMYCGIYDMDIYNAIVNGRTITDGGNMNENNYKAFLENDIIARDFIMAILELKLDALHYGNAGLNSGTGRELKTYYHNIADEWLKNYFENYSDWDYDEFKNKFATYGTRSNKLKIKE